MSYLLARAERKAARALNVFQRATDDLKKANAHLDAARTQASERLSKVEAKAKAEIARLTDYVEAHTHRTNQVTLAADAAKAQNNRVIAKIEDIFS